MNDPEGALVNLFPAIDKTAKRRRPKAGVGHRIRAFFREEQILISAFATGSAFRGISVDGQTFEWALYEFGRLPISHEGELDPRLSFTGDGQIRISKDRWILPTSYIGGMALAVIVAPENVEERTIGDLGVTVFGTKFALNDIWGRPDSVRKRICEQFKTPNLFSADLPSGH